MIGDCPSCADERLAGAQFCEACGRSLTGPSCPHCGAAGGPGPDGYCGTCGMLAGRPRDHQEIDASPAAAVTDRGRRHHRNEDAVWLAARGADADVVVCDGVSASFDPDVASAVAVETTGKLLATIGGDGDDLSGPLVEAVAAGAAAVAELARSGDPRRAASNPACTIVAACVRGTAIGYAWVGDSRAYWVPADGPAEQLTRDDSWAAHAIELGADPKTAMADPKAHAITAWLGADAPEVPARTGTLAVTAPGHLVVCSDGLWNYLDDPAEFAAAVRDRLHDGLPAAARALAEFANEAGGADNITVALIPVPAGPKE